MGSLGLGSMNQMEYILNNSVHHSTLENPRYADPHAFYTKPYGQNDIMIHQIVSSRMELNAGKVKLLPLDPSLS